MSEHNLLDKEVLELIEDLTSHVGHEPRGKDIIKDEAIDQIYKFAHAQLAKYDDGCKNPHGDWVDEMWEAYCGMMQERK